jgi:hypothetical protein
MANLNNLKVAAGSLVTFGGVDLGHTVDGTEISWERELTEVKTDIYGNTPVDYVLTGQKAMVSMKLAEITPNVLSYLIPEADYDVGSSDDHVHFGSKAGYSLRSDAYELVITPQGGNADGNLTITLFKAVQTGNITLAYKIDEQSVWDGVEFVALVDESRSATDGRLLGRMGPSAIS